jgi:hypothetical protein
MDDQGIGVRFLGMARNVSLLRFQIGSRAHPVFYPTDIEKYFPDVKRWGREAEQSLQPSAQVKNAWSYTSIPSIVFMAGCLIKLLSNFTFYFTT